MGTFMLSKTSPSRLRRSQRTTERALRAQRFLALITGLIVVLAGAMAPVSASSTDRSAAAQLAVDHLSEKYAAADLAGVVVTDEYTSDHNGVTHVYLQQTHDGINVAGAVATVNVQDGVVVFVGDRFIANLAEAVSGSQNITAQQAAEAAVSSVNAPAGAIRATPTLVYRKLDDGTARLAYNAQIATEDHWWNLFIDASDGSLLVKEDFVDQHSDFASIAARTNRPEDRGKVKDALSKIGPTKRAKDGSSYNVFPMPFESPLDGDRRIVHEFASASASPFGWHDTNGEAGPEHTITRGNNVNAYHDTVGVRASTAPTGTVGVGGPNEADPFSQPDGGSGLDFDHPIPTYDATPAVYRDAAVDNLFFWNNVMHDVTHGYGFNEEAGNFQETNYTGTGKGADAVLAEAQDGTYTAPSTSPPALNANFSTPPDGQPGRMQMYLWVDAFRALGGDVARAPSHQVRDGDLDAGVIAHEYGHGISNRLVGGPSNVSCLRSHDEREGEGWSDWWSYALTMRKGDDGATPRGIGNYVTYYDEGRTAPGIRITPYSTDMDINPSTYDTVKTAAEPHGVGYVWASMLWDLYWNLVEKHGFEQNPYESWQEGGNTLAMQLVVDGMKFAPCEPGFVDARDAIIAADAALTGDPATGVPGENECLIWSTFARRGLGLSADQGDPKSKVDGVEGYDVPAHCSGG